MNLAKLPPFNSTVGKLLRLPLRLLPRNIPMRVLQGPLRGARWIAGAHTHGCWLGSYEWDTQQLFWYSIPAGGVVCDIGANAGFYTLLAARKAKHVIAIEPLPENLRYLYKHLEMNRIKNVTVIKAAMSDVNGLAQFRVGGNRATGALEADGALQIRTTTVDSLPRAPDLIKIDVEGAEFRVLTGAIETIKRKHPIIFLSMHVGGSHCQDLLRSLGYTLKDIAYRDLLAVPPG